MPTVGVATDRTLMPTGGPNGYALYNDEGSLGWRPMPTAFSAEPHQQTVAGTWQDNRIVVAPSATTRALTAGALYFFPFWVGNTYAPTDMLGFHLSAATTATVVGLGIWAADVNASIPGGPGVLLGYRTLNPPVKSAGTFVSITQPWTAGAFNGGAVSTDVIFPQRGWNWMGVYGNQSMTLFGSQIGTTGCPVPQTMANTAAAPTYSNICTGLASTTAQWVDYPASLTTFSASTPTLYFRSY